jgi:hypothetical protein
MEKKVRSKKIGRKKSAALRSGKLIRVSGGRDPLAGAGLTPDLSPRNSAQSASSTMEHMAASVRNFLARCGYPIEEIIREVLIPKLRAKKTKFLVIGRKIETRVTDDHNIQLKTAVELLKMGGYYAAEKVEVNIDQINPIDMRNVSDDDIKALVKAAARLEMRNSASEGRILQAEPNDLASGG